MNGKIAVAGGNQCALAFALFAAQKGFDVTVFEKKAKDEVAYDWSDDLTRSTFKDTGLPDPPEDIRAISKCVAFVSPDKKTEIYVGQDESLCDFNVERRPFNDWLEGLATAAGARVIYSAPVEELILDGDVVKGVRLADGTAFEAGLVVDCCGVNSALRASLPDGFNITKNVDVDDTFVVKRAVWERNLAVEQPQNPKRLYLKHLGEVGISWSVFGADGKSVDVLIGRVGKLDDETYDRALADLRTDNPNIGDRVLGGGDKWEQIPIRHVISKLTADGYALLGDSACMTIPLMGSGMASGIRAAKMLAEVIASGGEDPYSQQNLYNYQYRFMKEIGTAHAAIEVVKDNLLPADQDDVNALMNSGLLAAIVMSAEDGKGSILKCFCSLVLHRPKLVGKLIGIGLQAIKAALAAGKIPAVYDEGKLDKWISKYEKAFE